MWRDLINGRRTKKKKNGPSAGKWLQAKNGEMYRIGFPESPQRGGLEGAYIRTGVDGDNVSLKKEGEKRGHGYSEVGIRATRKRSCLFLGPPEKKGGRKKDSALRICEGCKEAKKQCSVRKPANRGGEGLFTR